MRLKSYLLIAGVAATALFGAVPASADDAAEPRPPADCPAPSGWPTPPEGAEEGEWPENPGVDESGLPCGEDSGLTCEDPEAAESGLPCEDPEAAPPQSDEEAAEEAAVEEDAIEEEREGQMSEAEREAIEEAQAATPVERDPNYTG